MIYGLYFPLCRILSNKASSDLSNRRAMRKRNQLGLHTWLLYLNHISLRVIRSLLVLCIKHLHVLTLS
jgi:hypothetical protein